MSVFTRSKKIASSRGQIAIRGVQDDVLLLPNNKYRAVLQVSSINFELKSEAEQDALIDTYQSFLNSLATDLQIIVRVRELDLDKYLADFDAKREAEDQAIYRRQIENYVKFVTQLVTTKKILTRHFYVVVPLNNEADFDIAKEQLSLSVDIVAKGLARMGMQCRQLSSLELLDLFYSYYSPTDAKQQPLTDQTLKLLTEAYV